MIDALVTIGSIAAFFGIFDLFATREQKARISNYIFGFEDVTLSEFESSCIRALLSPFMSGQSLRVIRVAIYSVLVALVLGGVVFYLAWRGSDDPTGMGLQQFAALIAIFMVLSVLMIPFDYLSLRITKFFFWDRQCCFPKSWAFILCDVVLSTSLLVVLTLALLFAFNSLGPIEDGLPMSDYATMDWFRAAVGIVTFASIASIFSAALISAIQFLAILLGMVFRSLLAATRINRIAALHSNVHEHPFVFLGLIVGVSASMTG